MTADLADHPFSPENIARETGSYTSRPERGWMKFADECERLLRETAGDHEILFANALAHLGLAHLSPSEARCAVAMTGYRRAVDVCAATGVIDSALLDLTLFGEGGPLVQEVRGMLTSLGDRSSPATQAASLNHDDDQA